MGCPELLVVSDFVELIVVKVMVCPELFVVLAFVELIVVALGGVKIIVCIVDVSVIVPIAVVMLL